MDNKMMDCRDCENQSVCHAQTVLEIARINDIKLAIESLDYKNALDLLERFKINLMKRNDRITGRG